MSGGGAGKGGGGGGGGGAKGKAGGGGAAAQANEEVNKIAARAEERLENVANFGYVNARMLNGISREETKALSAAHKKNTAAINNEIKQLAQARKDAPRGAAKRDAAKAEDRAKVARGQYNSQHRTAKERINLAAAQALRKNNIPLNKTQSNALRNQDNINVAVTRQTDF